MKKLFPILLISILAFGAASCSINKNYQAKVGLHYTGVYTVKKINAGEVQFKEASGTYLIDSDTLKAGDKITINVIRAKNSSTANRIVSVNNQFTKN